MDRFHEASSSSDTVQKIANLDVFPKVSYFLSLPADAFTCSLPSLQIPSDFKKSTNCGAFRKRNSEILLRGLMLFSSYCSNLVMRRFHRLHDRCRVCSLPILRSGIFLHCGQRFQLKASVRSRHNHRYALRRYDNVVTALMSGDTPREIRHPIEIMLQLYCGAL